MNTAKRLTVAAPLTAAAIITVWVLRAVYGFSHSNLSHNLGVSMPWWEDPLRLLLSGLTSPTNGSAIVATAGLLTLGVTAEKALGTARYALAAGTIQVVGSIAGWLIITGLIATGGYWGVTLSEQTQLTPSVWICGVAAFASAWLSALWRRRVRVLTLTVAVTLFLFSGAANDFPRLAAVLGGLVVGQYLVHRSFRRSPSSLRERRILVVIMLLLVSISPLLAGLSHTSAAPLSGVAVFRWSAPDGVSEQCAQDLGSAVCRAMASAMNSAGVGAFLLNQLAWIIMAVIGVGLIRGRLLAWWSALAVMATTLCVNVWEMQRLSYIYELPEVKRLISDSEGPSTQLVFVVDVINVCLPWIVAIAVLVFMRRCFTVPTNGPAVGRMARRITITTVVSTAVWIIGGLVWADQFQPHATLGRLLGEWPLRYVPPVIGDHIIHPLVAATETTRILGVASGLIFWGGVLYGLYRAFVSVPDPAHRSQRDRARKTLTTGDADHMGWMTVWEGNSYFFDEDTGGYVAYRVHSAVAVTVGEPVIGGHALVARASDIATTMGNQPDDDGTGPADAPETGVLDDRAEDAIPQSAWDQARHELAAATANHFEDFASKQGWRIAWYSVRRPFADERSHHGWRHVKVAEEAVISTELTGFTGKKFQDVRTARNRAKKEGIRCVWTTWAQAGPALRERIIALSEDWVADKALPEMGFTLGGIDELKDNHVQLMLALDEDDTVHGVTSWLPVYEQGQLSGYILDFMRRNPKGFRPVVEFLIAETLVHAESQGLSWISLSGAPLAHSTDDDSSDLLSGVLEKVGASLEPLYGFRSLAFFKKKFHPVHTEWVLCYRDELALPAVGMAISQCYVPQVGAGQVLHAARVMARDKRG